jgi:hypothetical protein
LEADRRASTPDDPATSTVKKSGTSQNEEPAKTSAEKANVASEVGERTARTPVPVVTNVYYLTEDRPAWLESGPTYDGELFKVAVRGGPYPSLRKCESDLEQEIKLAVAEFTNDHLRAAHAATFISYSLKDLHTRKVVREQFSEQLGTSLGLMNQMHAQLVFDDRFRDELDGRWAEIRSKSRLTQTGLGTGIVLLLLGTLYSFLKLDTATRGYYTGRLQFAAATTILALVAASVLLMKWVPWM